MNVIEQTFSFFDYQENKNFSKLKLSKLWAVSVENLNNPLLTFMNIWLIGFFKILLFTFYLDSNKIKTVEQLTGKQMVKPFGIKKINYCSIRPINFLSPLAMLRLVNFLRIIDGLIYIIYKSCGPWVGCHSLLALQANQNSWRFCEALDLFFYLFHCCFFILKDVPHSPQHFED